MAINPAATGSALNNPTQRASELNDPQFSNAQGYFNYDLTHQEFLTPLFGIGTPCMHMHTVGGDRIVHHDNTKLVLNRINGNFLSQINQYVDTFYVPLRSLYPTNYEKLIPNPTKGQDLPNAALPQFPLNAFVFTYINDTVDVEITYNTGVYTASNSDLMSLRLQDGVNPVVLSYGLGRLALLATVFSRGQLLDYLGCSFDYEEINRISEYQKTIDTFLRLLYTSVEGNNRILGRSAELSLTSNSVNFAVPTDQFYKFETMSEYRNLLSDIFEAGRMPIFDYGVFSQELIDAALAFRSATVQIFALRSDPNFQTFIADVNALSNPFDYGFINLEKPLAYQQCIAQYFTNNSVDNIYNSDLFMQLLRSVMFPADENGYSREPTFLYNGVTTEYDYISCGATFDSLLRGHPGFYNRQFVWSTLMLMLRRTLRYGDYFSTARPNMLAVGQLSINVDDGGVSVIDITKNLLMQRYLNAANYIGSGFLQYMASIFGVTPSDTGTYPRFVAHRKIPLASDIVDNTSSEQGKQVTNLVGYSDNNAFDVFIDDFGVLISVTSFDVLPVYKSGIENSYHFSDRFDYFNPMLQGIGDQPIRLSELVGNPTLRQRVFGYTMRNAEYKWKTSRAHGAFVNGLPGFLMSYPIDSYVPFKDPVWLNIDPDFIRDKPVYLDNVIEVSDGLSPGEYYQFIVSCTNELKCARKIQKTPPVLF